MRKLATIQKISNLEPISGADKIEKANVLGWELVVKKGEFKVGDLCIYIEIDSIVPDIPEFSFLKDKKFRIKTIKLKNQISQGIALPISILKQIKPELDISSFKEDDEVTDLIGVKKYDPELVEEISSYETDKKSLFWSIMKFFGIKRSKIRKKTNRFPTHLVPKTDETRIASIPGSLIKNEGKLSYITEKLDGSSVTYILNKTKRLFGDKYNFYACSRNLVQNMKNENERLVQYCIENNIENKMKKFNKSIAIQGELTGPGIQKNPYKETKHKFRVFKIFDIQKQKFYNYNELIDACTQMDLEMVPVLSDEHVIHTDVKVYVSDASGKSKINPSVDREGIVVRLLDGDYSFKSISREFLLKNDNIKE